MTPAYFGDNEIDRMHFGDVEISKAYLGNALVFTKELPEPPCIIGLVSGGLREATLVVHPGDSSFYDTLTIGGSILPDDSNFWALEYFSSSYQTPIFRQKIRLVYLKSALGGKTPSHFIVGNEEIVIENNTDWNNNGIIYVISRTVAHPLNLSDPIVFSNINTKFTDGTYLYDVTNCPCVRALVSGGVRSFTLPFTGVGNNAIYYIETPTFDSNFYYIEWDPPGHSQGNTFHLGYLTAALDGKVVSHIVIDGVETEVSEINSPWTALPLYTQVVINSYTLANPAGSHTIDLKFTDGSRLYVDTNCPPPCARALVSGGVRSVLMTFRTTGQYLYNPQGGSISPADTNLSSVRWLSSAFPQEAFQNYFSVTIDPTIYNGKTPSHLVIKGVSQDISFIDVLTETLTQLSVSSYILVDPTLAFDIDVQFDDGSRLYADTNCTTLVSGGVRTFNMVLVNGTGPQSFYQDLSLSPQDSDLFEVSNLNVNNNNVNLFRIIYLESALSGKTPSHILIDGTENVVSSTSTGNGNYNGQNYSIIQIFIQPYTLANPTGSHTINVKFDDGTYLY